MESVARASVYHVTIALATTLVTSLETESAILVGMGRIVIEVQRAAILLRLLFT